MKIFQLRFVFIIAACVAVLFSACSERDIEKSDSVNMESSVSEEISSISDEEYAELLKQANIITQQLITYSFNGEAVNGLDKPSKLAINSFILTVPVAKEDGYMYRDFVMEDKSDEYSVYKYPQKNVQQIAYEVFGVDNWVLEGGNTVYCEEQRYYESALEFGIGGFLSCQDVLSTLSDNKSTIETTFLLTDYIGLKGEPGWNEYGCYTAEYQIISENNRNFLRFVQLRKIDEIKIQQDKSNNGSQRIPAHKNFLRNLNLTEQQQQCYIEKYVGLHPCEFQTWDCPEEIEAFRFGNFYGRVSLHFPEYSSEQFCIDNSFQYKIPQEILEGFVQLYFNVSVEHLRKSRFYDSKNKIYTGFLAAEGIPETYKIISIATSGYIEEIDYIVHCDDPYEFGEDKIRIGIDHSGQHFKFIYVERF